MSPKAQTEILIVDRSVADWPALVGDLDERSRVCLIGAGESLLDVLDRELVQSEVSAVHLVGHGRPGAITLGNSEIDSAWLTTHESRLRVWGEALLGADILLYGCETAKGREGAEFIEYLAEVTGAAVAASTRPVGRDGNDVNWTLDVEAGNVRVPVAFSAAAQAAYAHSLADATVTFRMSENQVFLDEGTSLSWEFEVDGDIPEGGVVVWLYADQPGASFVTAPPTFPELVDGDILPQAINQYDLNGAFFTPGAVENIQFFTATYPDPDVSTLTGLRPAPDFTVFQIPIDGPTGSITLPTFSTQLALFNVEGQNPTLPSPYSTVWKIVDAPQVVTNAGIQDDTLDVDVVFDGSPQVTVFGTRDDAPDNADPIAAGETYSVAPGETLTVAAAAGVLANDSDPDTDPLTAYILENPRNGSLTLNDDGAFEYTPNDGFTGTDNFTYLARDDAFGSVAATATVEVAEAGPPIVRLSASTDTLVESELDTVTFTIETENLPADGLIVSLGTYRPGDPDEETLKFGIADFALFPIFVPGQPPIFPILDGVETVGGWRENDGLTIRLTEEVATVTLAIDPTDPNNAPGETGFTRNNDVGVEQVEWRLVDFARLNQGLPGPDDYVVADGAGSVVLTLKDNPDQTYEAGDDRATTAGRTIELDVLANDNGGVEIVSVSQPSAFVGADSPGANGTVSINDNGTPGDTSDDTITYTPGTGAVGRDVFAYLVRNGDGEVDQARVTIDVTEFANAAPDAFDDSASTAFETVVEVDVLGNDSDPDGDEITITAVTPGTGGSVAIADQGTGDPSDDRVIFTPDSGFSGDATFTYTLTDAFGAEDTATVTVTVEEEPNTPPEAADDSATTGFETSVTIDVLANDEDADEDPLTIAAVTQGANGSVAIDDGLVLYTPDAGFEGEDTFTYTVSDGEGGEDTATVTVTVEDEPNTPPEAQNDTATTAFETAVTIDVLANDDDDDGDDLTILEIGAASNGFADINDRGTSDPSDDVIIYIPDDGFTGEDSFTYQISDGQGGSDTATVTVTVEEEPNTPPDAADDSATTGFETSVAIDVLANDEDADEDPLSIASVTQGANGAVNVDDGLVFYTPDAGFEGEDSFTYIVSDGNGGTDTATVTVTVEEPTADPVVSISSDTDLLVEDEGTVATFTINVDGPIPEGGLVVPIALRNVNLDTGEEDDRPLGDFDVFSPLVAFDGVELVRGWTRNDGLTLRILEDGATITLPIFDDDDQVPGGTVNDDVGTEETTFSIQSVDDNGATFDGFAIDEVAGSVTVTLTDTQNEAPVAADDTASTAFGTAVTIDVLGNDDDPDGDPLTLASVSAAANGTVEIVDGQAVYTPDAEFEGEDSFTYTVSDGQGGEDTGTVTVTVEEEPNTPPEASDDSATTAFETVVTIDVLANDDDDEGDDLTIASVTQGANGTVDVDDGLVFYTPDAGFEGEDTFTYTVSDGQGGEDTATVTVTVEEEPNTPPEASDDSTTTAFETAVTIDVLANDSDPEEDPLTLVSVGDAANGSVEIVEGEALYTPDTGFEGDDTFTYTVSDGQGGEDTGTVTVTVSAPTNADPDAVDDDLPSDQFGGFISLLDNDSDPDGGSLTVSAVNGDPAAVTTDFDAPIEITLASGARLFVAADGSASYDTRELFNFLGEGQTEVTDTFEYTVSDGQGGSDTATVTVSVTGEDDRPETGFDLVQTPLGTPIEIDVLANDVDPEGEALAISEIRSDPDNGTVQILDQGTADPSDDTILYTPDDGFTGQDFFRYRTVDPAGNRADAQVLVVTLTPENTAPTAVDDDLSSSGQPVDRTLFLFYDDLVGNDLDPDGDPLFITDVTQGTLGAVEFDRRDVNDPFDDEIRYVPGEVGTDTFTYTISDERGGISTATVTVNVTPPNSNPVAVDDVIETDEDTSVTFSLVANDSDPDGDTLRADPPSQIDTGRIRDNRDGTFTFEPFENASGTDSGEYFLSDGRDGFAFGQFTIIVNPVNDAPDAGDDLVTTDAGVPVEIDVLANDSDAEGDPLTLVSATDGALGTTEITQAGTIVYTPGADFSGFDTFTYDVSDGNGGVTTASVEVRETPDPVNVKFSVNTNEVVLDELTEVVWNFEVEGELPRGGVAVWFYADQPGAEFVTRESFFPDVVDGDIVPQVINQYDLAQRQLDGVTQNDVSALTGLVQFPDFTVFQALITEQTGSITIPAFDAPLFIGAEGEFFLLPQPNEDSPYSVVWKIADAPLIVDELTPASEGGRPDTVFNDVEFVGSTEITVYSTRDQIEENAAPDALDESYTILPGGTLSIDAAAGVLANDTDSDGDPLTAFILEASRNGTLTLNDDGSFTYTPDDGFEGEDSFTYLVRDDAFGSSVATATITVEDDAGGLNPVTGTAESDILFGTDGDDLIDGAGGPYDRLFGGAGEDVFVFGGETTNSQRDRDAIFDFELGVDSILLENGAEISASFEIGGRVYLQFTGDMDSLIVQGEEPLTLAGLSIQQDDFQVV